MHCKFYIQKCLSPSASTFVEKALICWWLLLESLFQNTRLSEQQSKTYSTTRAIWSWRNIKSIYHYIYYGSVVELLLFCGEFLLPTSCKVHLVKIWNEKLQDSLSVYYVVEICEFPWCTSKHKDDEKSST